MTHTEQLHGLYAITDSTLCPPTQFETQAAAVLRGGARIIQYRDKGTDHALRLQQARTLRQLCTQHQALLIINDDIALCLAVDADGVHLGEDDEDLAQARTRLGDRIIGVSCYNAWQRAETAQAAGADYVAFGAFYPSSTKPQARRAELDLLQRARQQLSVPTVAIGGIDIDNAAPLIAAGADMIAVISDLFGADDVEQRARHYTALFNE